MAHVAFPTDDAEIKALQQEATDPAAIKNFAKIAKGLLPGALNTAKVKFTQQPQATGAVTISAQKSLYKLVNMIDIASRKLVTGILVGFLEDSGYFHPVVYTNDVPPGNIKYRVGPQNGTVTEQHSLTSQYDKICKYLELKGYQMFWDRELDPRVKTEPGRDQKGFFKSFTIYKQDKVRIVINVADGGLPFLSDSTKNDIAGRTHGRADYASAADNERMMRLIQRPATVSYGIVYPNALEHNAIVRHNLGAQKDAADMSNRSTTVSDPKYSENIQDFVPAISFTQFLKVFKPENIDDLQKVLSFSSDILLHGRNILPIKILSTGWTNVAPKVRAVANVASDAGIATAPEYGRPTETVSFEELRRVLVNFVCSYGITHHSVNGVDIIFYDNKMLAELIKRLEIPSYKMKSEGDSQNRADYERYAEFSWHKYAIAKFLLPPYIIEANGDTILPIESYLHHSYVSARVGKYDDNSPQTTPMQKKVQSEIRAFISAIKAAANYPDLQPTEVARILNIALGFNI